MPAPWPTSSSTRAADRGHWRTSAIIVGNAIWPRALDWFVARRASPASRPTSDLPVYGDNLDKPVQADIGAHGSFDHRAKPSSPETWLNLRLGRVAGAAAGLAGGAVRVAAGAVRAR